MKRCQKFNLEDYAKWKRSVGLDPESKVFIVDASFPDLRAALFDLGWVENTWDPSGPWFDLKWTIQVAQVDYSLLRPPQKVNHYERSKEIGTKAALNSHLKEALESTVFDVNAWYPRSFHLSGRDELDAFILEFKSRKAEGILRQWVEHFKNCLPTSETFSDDLVRISLAIAERRVLDIDSLCSTDDNEAEFHGFWVTDEEWSVLAEVDLDNPSKILQQLERTQLARIEENQLRELRRRQAVEALERRTEELHKIQAHFCKKGRAASVPGRIAARTESRLLGSLGNAGRIFAHQASNTLVGPQGLCDRGNPGKVKHMHASTLESDGIHSACERSALFSRVSDVLEKLRASDVQFAISGCRNIWVLKPQGLARGEGIFLENDLDEILRCGASQRFSRSWIAQKYIENPLLIRGRKHDLRQWVLVTSWNPLTVHFFSEAYIRHASEEFGLSNIKNRAEHLTNLSVTRYHCQFDKFDEYWCCTWSQDAYQEFLHKQFGYDAWEERILPAMKRVVISSLQCVREDLWESACPECCFELLGYDFMVDDALSVWLLEVNLTPSMKHDTPVHARLVPAVLRDCLRVLGLSRNEQAPSPPCFFRLDIPGLFSSHVQSEALQGFVLQAQRLERPCPPQTCSPAPTVNLVERERSRLRERMEMVQKRRAKEKKILAQQQRVVDSLRRAGQKAWRSASAASLARTKHIPKDNLLETTSY